MQSKTKRLIFITLLSIYFAFYFGSRAFAFTETGKLSVSFLDIGQGDSIFIQTPGGAQMLIDGGKSGSLLLSKLREVMPVGDKSIDVVLSTHPDADHSGGLGSVIENYSVGEFIEPGMPSDTDTYTKLEQDVYDTHVPRIFARAGTDIILDTKENIVFHVLAPTLVRLDEDTNDASIVGILTYKEETFLLTGDASIAVEKEILAHKENIDIDVLKLGHHGSRTSSGKEFLEATTPETAIISAGCNNSYGHPHKEVTARITTLHIKSMSTCISGTITFMTDGKTMTTKTEK